MKTLLILISAIFLLGCPAKQEEAPAVPESPAEAPVAAAEIPPLVVPVTIPEEYRQIAEREITAENAEAFAAELEKEIEEDDE